MGAEKPAKNETHPLRKPSDRVIQARQEGVLASGTWDGGSELAVTEGTAQGDHPSHSPEGEHPGHAAQSFDEQARGREDPGADHVGDDDARDRTQPELALQALLLLFHLPAHCIRLR